MCKCVNWVLCKNKLFNVVASALNVASFKNETKYDGISQTFFCDLFFITPIPKVSKRLLFEKF